MILHDSRYQIKRRMDTPADIECQIILKTFLRLAMFPMFRCIPSWNHVEDHTDALWTIKCHIGFDSIMP